MLIYFLPAIVALGIITSYEDLKEGKIRNKYIIFSIIYSISLYAIFISIYLLQGILRVHYFFDVIINILFGIIVGFCMWKAGIWTAGDGKLFIAYTCLIPLTEYSNWYVPFFPSMAIIINTFVPFLIYLLFKLIIFTTAKQKIKALSYEKHPLKEITDLFLPLFALSWLSSLFFSTFSIPYNIFINLFIIFNLIALAQKIFSEKMYRVMGIISILRFLFDYETVFNLEFLKGFFGLAFFFFILRFFFLRLGLEVFTKDVSINKLKKGMVIAEKVYYDGKTKKYQKAKGLVLSTSFSENNKTNKPIFGFLSEGLEQKNIEKLIRLKKKNKLSFSKLGVQQTIPFAPLMFFGTMMTILSKGNFLIWIKTIIESII